MSAKGIWAVIKRFEMRRKVEVKPGRVHKSVTPERVEAVKTDVDAETSELVTVARVQSFDRQAIYSYSTVQKILRNIMHYFPYKIHHTQELLDRKRHNVFQRSQFSQRNDL
ncbi:hypothetical protein TNCV_1407261 [Trichonephila clavipes]|nr:hypothetical protein TNCV_1407261 [Trichonephila clavipes]